MKYKIVDEYFNKKTGISYVEIQTKYGNFLGKSYCSTEDDFSEFQGERIALIRAFINFYKYRISLEKIKYNTVSNILKDFYFNPQADPLVFCEKTYYHVEKERDRYLKNIRFFENAIKECKKAIKDVDDERQRILLRSKQNK